eukprot:TRINITY_DN107051_c0_g1_i1.p1 TRINITY_DN107051_c0_g1~~TRINITY_DN107051_c0_g1_i1.p1  ORF type:complete len:639 (+),score=84.96 TRINITY_DN107051_c0_g1_i1:36-1919(+)
MVWTQESQVDELIELPSPRDPQRCQDVVVISQADELKPLRLEISSLRKLLKEDMHAELDYFFTRFAPNLGSPPSDAPLRSPHNENSLSIDDMAQIHGSPPPTGSKDRLPIRSRSALPKRTLRSHRAQELAKSFKSCSSEDHDDDSDGSDVQGSGSANEKVYSLRIVPAPESDSPPEDARTPFETSVVTPLPPIELPQAMPDTPDAVCTPKSDARRHNSEPKKFRKANSSMSSMLAEASPGCLRDIVESAMFDYLSGALVVMNSITIGMQTDYLAAHVEADPPMGYRVVDIIFCVAFTLELVLRLCAYRMSFFYSSDWKWNMFDLLLVGMQLVDETLTAVASGFSSGGLNFSFMRVLRILRLIRIMRIIRILRLIGELRAIVSSIMGSMKSLAWTLALLFLLVYVFGVYFTQIVLEYRVSLQEEVKTGSQRMQPADYELEKYFGTLSKSILSLYQAITGGLDWSTLSSPLIDRVSVLLGLVFSFYIAFGVLALLNVVTGVFVEAALKSARDDKDDYMMNHVRDMLKGFSQDIDLTRFKDMLVNPQMQEFFKAIDVDISEAESVFHLLDSDESGTISLDEFMSGCLSLRGNAKALDVSILLHETRVFSRGIQAIEDKVLELQESLRKVS